MPLARPIPPLQRATAAALGAGCLLSLPLWTGARDFPLLPVTSLPDLGHFPLLVFVVSILLLFSLQLTAWLALLLLGTATWLVLSDITRLQPWFYLYLLMICGMGLKSPRILRLVMVSCYCWSGLQKFSVVFPLTIEPYVETALKPVLSAAIVRQFSPALLAIPVIEALLGLGLSWERTRKISVVGLTGMHLFILLMIGPTGRDYNSVVWPWNIFMIFALLALFRGEAPAQTWKYHEKFFLGVAGIFPVLGFFGFGDAYPSWALYAPRYHELQISLPAGSLDGIAADLRPHFSVMNSQRLETSAFSWSLSEMNVPPYAERRVMLQLAAKLCARREIREQLKFQLLSPPGRLSGVRKKAAFGCNEERFRPDNRALLLE
ncbi:MAG: DUF3556 domain-containing protein [Oligoflexia bacterium]|nr:DUF3556 domain-containing protein [Oligoflexia bacterium]